MDISVVIPAYNETMFISDTVKSIVKWMPSCYQFEVIVVDHGSTDNTASLATEAGAKVIDGKAEATIAALRNLGVTHAKGRLLLFIDADITLTSQWSENIEKVFELLDSNPKNICGSHPKVPEDSSLLMKSWFEPKTFEKAPTHIGSCHLIITRQFFETIGGFPGEMETSEEFTLCLNAKKAGGKIIAFPELVITHHGSPETLSSFFSREIWHGRGDWNSLQSMFSSKVAMLTLIFIALHLIFIGALIVSVQPAIFQLIPLLAIISLCVFSSFIKFYKVKFTYFLVNSLTFYLYFLARSFSLVSAVCFKKTIKHSRV
jgi:glycosyltransferase involved in cell wall biosynthesis